MGSACLDVKMRGAKQLLMQLALLAVGETNKQTVCEGTSKQIVTQNTNKRTVTEEAEQTDITQECMRAAKDKHKEDLNMRLDHFLNCLTSKLHQVAESTDEVVELQGIFDKVEEIDMFANDGVDHNLVKREAEDEYETDESRGWKNGKKKKKNKDKTKKKNRKKQIPTTTAPPEYDYEDEEEEYDDEDYEEEYDEEYEDEYEYEDTEEKPDPYTNGIQFSA